MLCRIFHKSNIGPPSGQRYAPFVEAEWDDNDLAVVPGMENGDEIAAGRNVSVGGKSQLALPEGNSHGTCVERNANDIHVEGDTFHEVCALYDSAFFFSIILSFKA